MSGKSSHKYTIGIDFGTLSARACLVDTGSGSIAAVSEKAYPHGVMDEYLMDTGIKLGPLWALQYPGDYLEALFACVRELLRKGGKNPEGRPFRLEPQDIIGISADFTSCTVISAKKDGTPLCMIPGCFKDVPHAYALLWKHHASQPYADKLNRIAGERGEAFLGRYGGKISSEWLVPKIMQIYEEAPVVYEAADIFIEGGDWISWMLTGNVVKNNCAAGFKAIWSKRDGYPSEDFFGALAPGMRYLVDEKLGRDVGMTGGKAGGLTREMAAVMGLLPETPVGVSVVDGHAMLPGSGITEPGAMLLILGTSLVHMVLGTQEKFIPGICGVVEDGIIPGYFCYEAGQAGGGDHFEWFVENCLPGSYISEADAGGINIHKLLREKARKLRPGESGLLALDWWNGNRSVLVDSELSGMILGCSLSTKPEEIYRALAEALAFGTRMILETYDNNGITAGEICAAGGMAEKDDMLMQIFADVTGREIKVGKQSAAAALGAAMFAAVAAGREAGGHDCITDAAEAMGRGTDKEGRIYVPVEQNRKIYDKLYNEYRILHDYFGRGAETGGNDVMRRLRDLTGSGGTAE